jgi:hypothetical protein
MAELTITLTVPDKQMAEIIAALEWRWGRPATRNGEDRGLTPAEAREVIKQQILIKSLETLWQQYREQIERVARQSWKNGMA